MFYEKGPKIVVIGGGNGLNNVIRGLKNYTSNITAIVTVSDYGNAPTDSRAQLNLLPMDDIKDIYKKLNATFDLHEGERDADDYIPELLKYLKEHEIKEG